jgi:transposase
MIALPAGRRVLIWSTPVDFAGAALRVRCGMDRLAALVQVTLRADPFAGDVFVFRSRRADRVKLLVFDGTGLVLVTKRLEQGRFVWPPVTDGMVRLSALQLSVLLSGLSWQRLQVRPVTRPRAVQRYVRRYRKRASMPPIARRYRASRIFLTPLARRLLAANERMRARMPGFFRTREASSAMVTSRT